MRDTDKRVHATARVRLTVEIPVPDTWGPETSVEQIQRQAAESAMGLLRRIVEIKPAPIDGLPPPPERRETAVGVMLTTGHAKILDADVTVVLVEQERR